MLKNKVCHCAPCGRSGGGPGTAPVVLRGAFGVFPPARSARWRRPSGRPLADESDSRDQVRRLLDEAEGYLMIDLPRAIARDPR